MGDDGARDLVVDRNGNVQIYNGTFSPRLSQYNAAANTFTHQTGDFSTANVLTYGAIATFGDSVFVADWATGGSDATGILRFSLSGAAPQRVGLGHQPLDLSVGRDGLLYALRGGAGSGIDNAVDVYEPSSMSFLRTVTFPEDLQALTVDGAGNFFVATPGNQVRRYSPTGTLVDTLPGTNFGGMADIDIDDSGRIVVASHIGAILFSDSNLDTFSTISLPSSNFTAFAAWVQPPPVPEPTTLGVLAAAAATLLPRRRSRRRRA